MCKIESSAVFGTFDRIAAEARRHCVGGVLQGENLKGLYRRAARITAALEPTSTTDELERLRAALDVSDKYWRGENITPFEVILAIRAALESKP